MKKKYSNPNEARNWNNLVKKFLNLYKRIKKGDASEAFMQRLVIKLNNLYQRLEKMQYRVGIKLAGTTLALMLASTAMDAQSFSYAGKLNAYNSSIRISNHPSHVFADIDKDDDLDLFIGNDDGTILTFKNDGNGNFLNAGNMWADGAEINVGSSSRPAFADIDTDGDLDLYVGLRGIDQNDVDRGKIKVFMNNGNGIFNSRGNLKTDSAEIQGERISKLTFADIDGDNDLDFYVSNGFNILIYENDGNGNFSDSGYLQADDEQIVVTYKASPTFADIDNDGDLDLCVGSQNGSTAGSVFFPESDIRVFENNGSGIFSSAGNLMTNLNDSTEIRGSNLDFADIDGDDDLDLYVSGKAGFINIYTNDGNGNFTEAGNLKGDIVPVNVGEDATPVFADIDGDNDLDLFVGSKDGVITVYNNDGNGKFSEAGNLQSEGNDIDNGDHSAPAFADIDRDGDMDLYLGYNRNDDEDSIKVYSNDGNGNFLDAGKLQANGLDIKVDSYPNFTFADIDTDNDLDLYNVINGKIVVYTNQGNGDFSFASNLQADGKAIALENRITPVFADIDADDDFDLLIGQSNGTILSFENDGNGNFSNIGLMQVDGDSVKVDWNASPTFADIDGDNDLDLYVGTGHGYIEVFINDGATSIREELSNSDISIYPNPSQGIFTIETDGDYRISVYDIMGKQVEDYSDKKTSGTITINLVDQRPGIYFVKFQSDENIVIEKITLEK